MVDDVVGRKAVAGEQLVALEHPQADVDDLVLVAMNGDQAEPIIGGGGVHRLIEVGTDGGAVILDHECPHLGQVFASCRHHRHRISQVLAVALPAHLHQV
ncbi:hypothetical protein D1872_289270 [compost metagenome]